jgi:hypothetical protein
MRSANRQVAIRQVTSIQSRMSVDESGLIKDIQRNVAVECRIRSITGTGRQPSRHLCACVHHEGSDDNKLDVHGMPDHCDKLDIHRLLPC